MNIPPVTDREAYFFSSSFACCDNSVKSLMYIESIRFCPVRSLLPRRDDTSHSLSLSVFLKGSRLSVILCFHAEGKSAPCCESRLHSAIKSRLFSPLSPHKDLITAGKEADKKSNSTCILSKSIIISPKTADLFLRRVDAIIPIKTVVIQISTAPENLITKLLYVKDRLDTART